MYFPICQKTVCYSYQYDTFSGSDVRVRELNWLENEYKSNESEFGWSSKDLECLKEIEVILAADGMVTDF